MSTPYATGLIQRYIRDIVPDALVQTQWTQRAFADQPYVLVRPAAGSSVGEPGRLLRATMDIDTYAKPDVYAVTEFAQTVHMGLWNAWRGSKFYDEGWISAITVLSDPVEQRLEGQPDEIYRCTATYRFMLRSLNP